MCISIALPGSILITMKCQNWHSLNYFTLYQLQEDKAMDKVVHFSWKCIGYNVRSNLMYEIRFLEF